MLSPVGGRPSHIKRPDAELRIDRISKSYGAVKALDEVSLTVRPGELLTILGASGSGKTTLLKIISGFEYPDSGSVSLGDQDFTHVPPSKRNIGMVFQNYALFPHMTVEENIAFPLTMRKIPRDLARDRVAHALKMVELTSFGKRLPSQLSGGQQQRVALARAVLFHPNILLLDEPFGALDRKLRETMQLEVRRLQQQLGLTTIFITHDQEEALIMSDRVAIIGRGTVWQVGTPEEVYEKPLTRDVANFVGESNIVVAHLDIASDRPRLRLPFGQAVTIDPRRFNVLEAAPGDKTAMIRPERVILNQPPTGRERVSARATIVEKIYIGLSIKFRLRTETGHELLARVEPHHSGMNADIGDDVEFSIEPSAIHLLSS